MYKTYTTALMCVSSGFQDRWCYEIHVLFSNIHGDPTATSGSTMRLLTCHDNFPLIERGCKYN